MLAEVAGELALGILSLRGREERRLAAETLRASEESLRKSETRYHSLFDGVPVGLYLTTSDGQILEANPALVEMLGYPDREALLAARAEDFYIHPETRAQWQASLQQKGIAHDFEVQYRRRDGAVIWVRDNCRVVQDEQGRILYYEGSLQDITARHQMEEQLLQAQKLESISTLASGIAHDFNNMLAIILGNATLLAEQTDDPAVAKRVKAIMETTERGVALVRQILTFARRTSVEPEALEVNAVVGELVKLLAETFPKTITISLQLARCLPTILFDRTQLHQALLNLCINACDAMSGSGTITIGTGLVHGDELADCFPAARATDYVSIRVTDTGVGMDEGTRRRLFEPFFTTKEKGKGTGLGLAVLYGVVQLHQGFVEVESTLGRGATFRLHFPALEKAERSPGLERYQLEEAPGGAETILVIEHP